MLKHKKNRKPKKDPIERERRWLVKGLSRAQFEAHLRGREANQVLDDPPMMGFPIPPVVIKHIVQGYFEVLGEQSFRVRITDGKKAVETLKIGSGESRVEREKKLSLAAAKVMLSATLYQVTKTRYVIDGWELDFFEGPLTGIVILEYEAKGDEPIPSLPPWIEDATDVTDSLTNLHLARMAREFSSASTPVNLHAYLQPRLPKIVITGGPCSGKSTLMKEIATMYGLSVHLVPEVATILIAQLGLSPINGDAVSRAKFQSMVYRIQRAFEEAAEIQAIADGKKAIVLDRGTIDAIAYLKDTEEFERIVGCDYATERNRYQRVLALGIPPKDVYDANARNNPARSETYEHALWLSVRTINAWQIPLDRKSNSLFQLITGETWEEKRNAAFKALNRFLFDLPRV